MTDKITENFEILERSLTTSGMSMSCLGRLAEIKNALHEAEKKHVTVDMSSDLVVLSAMEAVIGPLIEAGDNLSRCVQTRRNVNNAELQGWADKWVRERVG